MKTTNIPKIRGLSNSEKLLLVQSRRNEMADVFESLSISEGHKRELKKSVDEFKRNPREGSSWEDVKRRLIELEAGHAKAIPGKEVAARIRKIVGL